MVYGWVALAEGPRQVRGTISETVSGAAMLVDGGLREFGWGRVGGARLMLMREQKACLRKFEFRYCFLSQ